VDVPENDALCMRDMVMSGDMLSDIVALEQRVRNQPDDVISWKLLGIHHLSCQALEKALENLEMAVKLGPDDPDSHQWLGLVLGKMGRSEEGLLHLDESLRLCTNDDEMKASILRGRAPILTDLGRREEAISSMRESLRFDPENSDTCGMLAILLNPDCIITFGKDSGHVWNGPREPPPMTADQWVTQARELVAAEKVSDAWDAYNRAIDLDRWNVDAWHGFAVLVRDYGNPYDAQKLFRQAVRLRRKNPRLLIDYGVLLYMMKKWKQASNNLRKAIDMDSQPEAWHYLGLVLARQDRVEEAIDALTEAKTLSHGEDSRILFSLACLLFESEDLKGSRRAFLDAVGEERGEDGYLTKQANRARRRLGRALKLAPSKMWMTISDVFFELGRKWEGVQALWTTVLVDPEHARAWYRLYQTADSKYTADMALDRAYLADREDPDILFGQGVSFYDIGMKVDAYRTFEEVLRLEPGYSGAESWMERIESEFEELEGTGHSPWLRVYGYYHDDYYDGGPDEW